MTTITAAESGTWALGGDLPVRRMGFGAMRLTGTAPFHQGVPRDREQSLRVLRRAVELGVNHIDTAAFYFSQTRSANELINTALSPYADDLVIATKIGPVRDVRGEFAAPARPDELRGHVEENLRQLGREHMDLVYLRLMGQDSLAEHFGALAELREAGLVRHLGISNVKAAHLKEALEIAPVAAVQNPYGIDRRDDETLTLCGERGVAFVPFFSGAKPGREAQGGGEEHAAVLDVARAHGVSATQVRHAWVLGRGEHVLAIAGTGSVDHLEDNVAAGAVRLTEDEVRTLDALAG
ncbi:aldo/keto reductase [Streptomyces sp. SID11385]|uniref:aldo/keto reductase n=1 Tax=Streptomyces sp. SID11385 TaxID=2706031 RepID=UPI0013CA939A|nr:aldo/keto reductase [Streptomyces sp. SID11385]NEA39394.1 aldo/keto reductase [Streptomyces sp. SID11385]